jgi:hypothetical protein
MFCRRRERERERPNYHGFNCVTFLSGVDVLTGVEALGGDHELLLETVLVAVAEGHDGQRRATARVVDDLAHDALDEAVSLGVIHRAELGRTLAMEGVRLEARTGTFSLSSDDSAHLSLCSSNI